MVAKTMTQEDFCRSCSQADKCQDVYRKLGKAEGPSVAWGVVVAFLLPLVVFIAVLAVFKGILADAGIGVSQEAQNGGLMNAEGVQTAISFLLALAVTFIFILIIKKVTSSTVKDK